MALPALVVAVVALAAAHAAPAEPYDPFQEVEEFGTPETAILGAWTTEHHDAQNTGRSPVYFNVSVYNGACQTKVASPSAGTFFASAGTTSTGGRKLFIGDSGNTVYVMDLTQAIVQQPVKLPGAAAGGVVVSPAVASRTPTSDWVFVGSTNSILYALDSQGCTESGTCILWQTLLQGPIMASPRYINNAAVNATYTQGIVLVSSTSNSSDCCGVLYAVNAANGSIIWHFNTSDPNSPNGSYGLRYIPAVDPQRPSIGYLAYGTRVIAFNLVTGATIFQLDTGKFADPFVSSVSVPFGGDALMVQSMSTSLWRINITQVSLTNVTLAVHWSCFYPDYKTTHCTQFSPLDGEATETITYDDFGRVVAINPASDDVASLEDLTRRLQGGGIELPFSTPAISPDEAIVAFGTYNVGGSAMFLAADIMVGTMRYSFNGTGGVSFGNSRSSPALDRVGMMFISSLTPDGQTSHPVLWCLDLASEEPHWMMNIGSDGDDVGSSSPLVTQTLTGAPLVVAVSEYNLWFFTEGMACPSNTWEAECSGNGVCNCQAGTCTCNADSCFTGPGCDIPLCGNHSTGCNNGICQCDPCWTGPTCNVPLCGANGASCSNGQCTCKPCYTGPTCGQQVACGQHSLGCSNGTCICLPCWSGPFCNISTTCGTNQQCNPFTGQCQCDNCYTGTNCMTLNTCNGNGQCNLNTGQCSCSFCFSGSSCTTPTNCGSGICNTTTQSCQCNPNYAGSNCNQCQLCHSGANCADVCSNRGVCTFQGCQCPDGFGGDNCEEPCAPCMTGSSCTVYNQCSGHGNCQANVGCKCEDGWAGWTCGNSVPLPGGSNGGAIAGGILGTLAFVGACAFAFYKRDSIRSWWSTRGSGFGKYSNFSGAGGSTGAFTAAPATTTYTGYNPKSSPAASGAYGSL